MKVGDYVRTKYGIAKITKIDLNVNACEIDRQLKRIDEENKND